MYYLFLMEVGEVKTSFKKIGVPIGHSAKDNYLLVLTKNGTRHLASVDFPPETYLASYVAWVDLKKGFPFPHFVVGTYSSALGDGPKKPDRIRYQPDYKATPEELEAARTAVLASRTGIRVENGGGKVVILSRSSPNTTSHRSHTHAAERNQRLLDGCSTCRVEAP